MEYSKLVAVTGLPGLYELVNSKTDGAIVRSLEDNSTKFASSRIHNFSHLESIEVYTVRDNVNLVEIFQAMEKAGGSLPDGKDNAALKKYFEKAYPDLDFERVYASDLKKMVKWFDILKKKNVELKLSEPPVEEEPEAELAEEIFEEIKEEAKEDSSAPITTAKKTAKKKEEASKEEKEEKPVKKKAAAKTESKKESAPAKAKKEKEEKDASAPLSMPKKKAAPKKK